MERPKSGEDCIQNQSEGKTVSRLLKKQSQDVNPFPTQHRERNHGANRTWVRAIGEWVHKV